MIITTNVTQGTQGNYRPLLSDTQTERQTFGPFITFSLFKE